MVLQTGTARNRSHRRKGLDRARRIPSPGAETEQGTSNANFLISRKDSCQVSPATSSSEARMNDGPHHELRVRRSFGNLVQCAECGCVSGLQWPGWRAYRMDDPARAETPELAFFCPECAEREFGCRTVSRVRF
jgi:hypothetical protein